MDAIPFLSQTKSLFQAVCFDFDGARRTQENFSRQCPVVSQIRSACEWAQGDSKAARETQEQCLGFLSDVVDGIPAVGHVKGGIHYAFGDKDGGDKAMKSASRTTGVMGGGVVGFFAGGPIGAAAGGVAGGLAMDGLTTGIDSAVHKEYRPSGMVAQVTEIAKDPKNPGVWFDTMAIPVFDAMTGVSAGKGAARIANKIKAKRLPYNKNKAAITRKVGKANYKQIKSTADLARKQMKKGAARGAKKHAHVVSQARDLKTGKTYTGKNLTARLKRPNTKKNMSGLKGRSKSSLQKKVSNAQRALNRDPHSCAEHQAVSKLYIDRPSAKPGEIRTSTVIKDAKTGEIRALKRCDNCMQFGDAMGSVPTDEIARMVIIEDPGYPVSKRGAAMVGGSVALAAMKQPKNGSTKTNRPREKTDKKVKTSKQQVTVVSGKSADESSKEETLNELKIVTKTTIHVKTKACRKYRTYRGRVGNSKMKKYSIVVKQSRGSKDCVKVAGNQSDDPLVYVMNETGSQENLNNWVDENDDNEIINIKFIQQ